uniref:BTB domain-containing protein n=1 Tax=Panagrolaimus sp. PS1159 TaxID=55785 RepID=A0AC35FI18_9BILA
MEPVKASSAEMETLAINNNNNTNLVDMNLNRLSLSPATSTDSEPGDPLTKRLNHFRQIGVGCDVAFIVGEEKEIVKAHKLVLGCSSDVFYAMFYGPITERCTATYAVNPLSSSAPTNPSPAPPAPGVSPLEDDCDSLDSVCSSEESECSSSDEHDDSEGLIFGKKEASPLNATILNDPSLIGHQIVQVPDISPTAFKIMVDYIYSNFDVKGVAINDDNVMHTLYGAKKYDIKQLVSACVRYLLNGLTASNALCLLAQARLFDENHLIQRCYEVIDKHTDTVLMPENVTGVDRNTLMEVLSRSHLDPTSELVVFRAAVAWAEAECERRQLAPVVENLRQALGPALQLIRFPLMDVYEFGKAAISGVLTCEEMAEVYLYLTVKPHPHCRYPTLFRCSGRSKHVVQRFTSLSSKKCTRRENKICFTADREIYVRGFGIYGIIPVSKTHIGMAEEKTTSMWTCQVEIQLATVTDPSQYSAITSVFATNTVFLQGPIGDSTPIVAYFAEPVQCHPDVTYVATIKFAGENAVQTFQGKDGQESVTINLPYDEKLNFKFQGYRNSYGSDEGGRQEGQIPSIHFYCQWPLD